MNGAAARQKLDKLEGNVGPLKVGLDVDRRT